MLQITVPITTRAEMNTTTPRVGQWTYHHVLPVRVYFLMASTILRVILDPRCDPFGRVRGTDTLKLMCQYAANHQRIALFTSDVKWRYATPTDADFANHAKLCGSPPFGGFGGLHPAQRSDDPHEQEEPNRPISASQPWWDAIKAARQLTYDAFGLIGLPDVLSSVTASKEMDDWEKVMFKLCKQLQIASAMGLPRFSNDDWACSDDHVWTVLSRVKAINPLVMGPTMKLRLPVDRRTFIDTAATPIDALIRRNAHVLAPVDDHYYRAAP